MENENLNTENVEMMVPAEYKLKGWLWLFVWIGMFGGSILAIGNALKSFNAETSAFEILCSLIYAAFFFVIAVMGVLAFKKKDTNAVALGYTYIIMVLIDAVYSIVYLISENTFTGVEDVIRSFVWAIIWMSFLHESEDVKNFYPKETREWRKPEIVLLTIFATFVAVISILTLIA